MDSNPISFGIFPWRPFASTLTAEIRRVRLSLLAQFINYFKCVAVADCHRLLETHSTLSAQNRILVRQIVAVRKKGV